MIRAIGDCMGWQATRLPLQERLTAGYYSLAERLREKLHVNVSIAPAGLAWQQVHRMSIGSTADELPEGKFPNFLLSHISRLKVIIHTAL